MITLLRRLGLTVLVLLLLPLIVLAALWPLTPSVADAEQRVQARLAAHSAQDLGALPRPDRAAQALIATEDSRFYTHHGIDLQGVVRAAIGFAQGSRDPGGATLDQQLAKNLYTSDSLLAKVEQVELAVKLEARYSKPEILEMYLAEVYFGHGYFGLSAASRGFFDRAPADLTWGQASLLAGLVNAPSAYDPLTHLRRARQRQRHVLDRLVAVGTLTRAGADAAYLSPVHLVPT